MTATLADLRRQRGYTLAGLSVRAGIAPSTLHYIECYGHIPTAATMGKLARALGVPTSELWPDAAEAADRVRHLRRAAQAFERLRRGRRRQGL